MSVFFLFALATVVGCLSTLFWIPEDDLGRGYFQMNALIILGLMALLAAVVVLHPILPFAARPDLGTALFWLTFAAALFYYFAVWKERWRIGRWPLAVATVASTAALLLAAQTLVSRPSPLPQRDLQVGAMAITSALLLGWSLIAMLLGHWYLVAPRLSFRHLTVFCWVLLATVILRILAVVVTVLVAATLDPLVEPHPLRLLAGVEGQGMFFWFRLLWGLLIPLLLAAMALHCARKRSNQSATGILYVLVVGTFIGEITAFYLAVTTGIPA